MPSASLSQISFLCYKAPPAQANPPAPKMSSTSPLKRLTSHHAHHLGPPARRPGVAWMFSRSLVPPCPGPPTSISAIWEIRALLKQNLIMHRRRRRRRGGEQEVVVVREDIEPSAQTAVSVRDAAYDCYRARAAGGGAVAVIAGR